MEYYKGKKVIWESKWKRVLLIAVCFFFTGEAIYVYDKANLMIFIGTILLFGFGGIIMLVLLLNPKNLYVTYNSPLGKEILAEQGRLFIEGVGEFAYDENGFSRKTLAGSPYHRWTDIETVFGYKVDRFTTDEITLNVFLSDGFCITIDESEPGWFQFNEQLTTNIMQIPKAWYFDISIPAFETNLTLLYDRQGRTFEDAVAAVYRKD